MHSGQTCLVQSDFQTPHLRRMREPRSLRIYYFSRSVTAWWSVSRTGVHLGEDANGIAMNAYFAEHPEQIVGKMEMLSGPYGMESTCRADDSRPFAEQLAKALQNITGQIDTIDLDEELADEMSRQSIPADPSVKNFSYTVVDNEVYYRENSVMKPVEVSDTAKERIKGNGGNP